MSKLIFVNLPVTDLKRSMAFYEAVGATNNANFTDDTAACMVISETIHTMLLTHDKWRQFTSKAIVDALASAQVLLCLSEDSRDAVSAMVEKAAGAGGKPGVAATICDWILGVTVYFQSTRSTSRSCCRG